MKLKRSYQVDSFGSVWLLTKRPNLHHANKNKRERERGQTCTLAMTSEPGAQ